MRHILALAVILAIFSGCSSKKLFEPQNDIKSLKYTGYMESFLIDSRIDGATYEDGSIVTADGFYKNAIEKKETLFINETAYSLIASNRTELIVIDKKEHSKTVIPTTQKAISANLDDTLVCALLADNTLMLYDRKSKNTLFKSKQKISNAVTNMVAKPLFFDDLIIFPTLDGKIVIVDREKKKELREFIVSSEKYFNNIIFLKIVKEKIIAATKHAVFMITPKESYELKADINTIFADEENLYITTINGKIMSLDFMLETKNEIKLPFAGLISLNIKEDRVYAVERSGYLILLDHQLERYDAYVLGDNIEDYMFINSDRLYYKKRFIELP